VWQEKYLAFQTHFQEYLPLIVLLWCVGILCLTIRFIGGFAYIQRLKHHKTIALPEHWHTRLATLARNAGVVRQILLVESALVKVPMVVGYIKPVILLPLGTIIGIPAAQVEAILAHEIAHISRNDYLVNLLQCLAEIIFFYHPAIWWISAIVREEREHCCDDIALSLCGDRVTFAKALASLEHFYAGTPALALGLPGNGQHLLSRIRRLVQEPRRTPSFADGFLAAFILMISLAVITVSASTGLQSNPANVSERPSVDTNSVSKPEQALVLPSDSTQETFTYKGTRNGKKYNIRAIMKKGTIVTLYIDGKKIPDSEKSKYYGLIYELMGSVPAPPSPALAPGRIDPGFPVEPVVAPVPPDLPAAVALSPDNMHAILTPPGVPDKIRIDSAVPHPPVPSIAPMTPDQLAAIIQAAFRGDTSHRIKGDFVYQFTGKRNKAYTITIKDGMLTDLQVDGKKIDRKDYAKYAHIMEELKDELFDFEEYNQGMQNYGEAMKQYEMDMQEQERAMQEQDRAMAKQEQAIAKQEESARLSKELIHLLDTELLKDKLIQKDKTHYIQISPAGLFIDSHKQPEEVFSKYKSLLENKARKPMTFTIQYHYNPD
jgi:beta-lactamase regulating signal transducer with metallopeptidase domain